MKYYSDWNAVNLPFIVSVVSWLSISETPIANRRGSGYYYDLGHGEKFELPGVWFNADEIIALALLAQLTESMQPALVSELLKPLGKRLHNLLAEQNINPQHWQQGIRVTSQWQHPCHPHNFKLITSALLHRKQLQIYY